MFKRGKRNRKESGIKESKGAKGAKGAKGYRRKTGWRVAGGKTSDEETMAAVVAATTGG
ncbi:hypothetical protein [Streptomyces sp. NPDC018045]|uniref:hypothetical protein n=1 Tax=Streptomyces sp. NPDC018045 TaxID=3365037 RepID=UPI0037BABB3D